MMPRPLILALAGTALLAGCVEPVAGPGPSIDDLLDARDTRLGRSDFVQMVDDVEPVAEQFCRNATRRINCDFRIVVDDDPAAPPIAFITLDERQRPVVVFTVALIDDMQNIDEMAFVLSHEAAHHISEHFRRGRENAEAGAAAFEQLAGLAGATSPEQIQASQQLGALVGQRTYSREFELEADALGTRIAATAGYNPVRGAQFFFRIPDPGDRFLGTHPPNQQRVDIVNQTAREIGL